MLDWLWRRWVGRPVVDLVIAGAVVGLHVAVVRITGAGDVLGWPGREQRIAVYTTTATVVAIIGSFITAAVTLYAAATGPRMRVLRTHPQQGPEFRRNWMSILSATLVVSGLCLLAVALDTTEHDPVGAHWLAEGAAALGVARAVRLMWLFGKVIIGNDLDLGDARDPASQPSAPVRQPGA
ncbi:hypothetical protein ACIRPT_33995 [Streptomyces sp. NPDC101227]|uniref:hypothetical protein n=1 Tax=Streptomyces sp. NPDC101227 TaxID=3366136 RepID=UPI003814B934